MPIEITTFFTQGACMPQDESIYLSLQLPFFWWRRLQRVAETCSAAPKEFAREIIEAEIVRRELLLEKKGQIEDDWLAFVTGAIPDSRLH
jgi:hypothetical protein